MRKSESKYQGLGVGLGLLACFAAAEIASRLEPIPAPRTYELDGTNCPAKPAFEGRKVILPPGCVLK